jgi:hypothetical protein
MLEFFKKLFGAKPVEVSPAPYKVETPTPVAETAPAVKKAVKKPAVKKATTRKPRAPKA